MESTNCVNLPNDGRMTATFISTSYNITMDHLKTNIFSPSFRLIRSIIMKIGARRHGLLEPEVL